MKRIVKYIWEEKCKVRIWFLSNGLGWMGKLRSQNKENNNNCTFVLLYIFMNEWYFYESYVQITVMLMLLFKK